MNRIATWELVIWASLIFCALALLCVVAVIIAKGLGA